MFGISIITLPVGVMFVLVTVAAIASRQELTAKRFFASQIKNELIWCSFSALISFACFFEVRTALYEHAVLAGGRYVHDTVLLASRPVAFWFWTMFFYFFAVLSLVWSFMAARRIITLHRARSS